MREGQGVNDFWLTLEKWWRFGYTLSKSTKRVFNVQRRWPSSNTLPNMVHVVRLNFRNITWHLPTPLRGLVYPPHQEQTEYISWQIIRKNHGLYTVTCDRKLVNRVWDNNLTLYWVFWVKAGLHKFVLFFCFFKCPIIYNRLLLSYKVKNSLRHQY